MEEMANNDRPADRGAIDGRALAAFGALLALSLSPGVALGVSCGDVITSDTVLDGDLGPCRSDSARALTVVGPARLDLNGFRVRCFADPRVGTSVGILIEGRRAEVTNGAVSDCGIAGVELQGGGGHVVKTVLVEDCSDGFDVDPSSIGNTLVDNVARSNAIGFDVDGRKSRLLRNLATGSGVGFELENGAEGTELIANVATGNGDGFSLDSVTRNVELRGNLSLGEGAGSGFVLYGRGHRLSGNRALGHAVGISVRATQTLVFDLDDAAADCDDNRWRDNVFTTRNQPCIR
jgi:hypothetical protein